MSRAQLRGQKLLDAIESKLTALFEADEKYVYNASELSREVGCSRPTLIQKQEFIDDILNRLGASKRLKREHPLIEQLNTRIEQLEVQKANLEAELNSLQCHHADIFSRLYRNSHNISKLIQPIVKEESISSGKCILCNHPISPGHDFKDVGNIVSHPSAGKPR